MDEAVDGGCVHVLVMSEPMTAEQYNRLNAAGVEIECAAEIGYDVIAFVTNIDNRLNDRRPLLRTEVREILSGDIKDWEETANWNTTSEPIYIFARPGSGTTDWALRQYTQEGDANHFPPRANYIACDDNLSCLNQTLSTPGGMYWVSTAWIKTQPEEYLHVLPILTSDERPVNPMDTYFSIRSYPDQLIRPLYMYVLDSPNNTLEDVDRAKDFLSFVRGIEGQQILEENRFFAYFSPPPNVPIDMPPGFTSTATDGPRQVCRS